MVVNELKSDNTWFRSFIVAAGTQATIAAKASASRKALTIFNSGQTTVHIHNGEDVSSARGITLTPDGAASFTEIEDFAAVRQGWYVLSDASGGQITVYESLDSGEGGV